MAPLVGCSPQASSQGGDQPEPLASFDSSTPAQGECPPGRVRQEEGCRIELQAPVPPRFRDWDCPEGWLSFDPRQHYHIQDGGALRPHDFLACRPPETPAAAQIPYGQRKSVHSAAPVRMGPACPPPGERWPEERALRQRAAGYDGPILYIDPSAASGGAGSRQDPFSSLTEALGEAPPGSILALGRGVHQGQHPHVHQPVAVLGACVEDTLMLFQGRQALRLTSGGVLVEGLALDSESLAVHMSTLEADAPITLRSLEVRHAGTVGIEAYRSRVPLVLEDIALRTSEAHQEQLRFGLRVREAHASVDLKGVWVQGHCQSAVNIGNATRVRAHSLYIEAQQGPERQEGCIDRGGEAALDLGHITDVELRDVVVRQVYRQGVTLGDQVEQAQVQSVHIEDVHPRRDETGQGYGGRGLALEEVQDSQLRQVLVERAFGSGVWSEHQSGLLELEDVLVADTHSDRGRDFRDGAGVKVVKGQAARLKRIATFRTYHAGVSLGGDEYNENDRDARYEVQDLWAWGVRSTEDRSELELVSFYAPGLLLNDRPTVTGGRILIEGATGFGLQAQIESGLNNTVHMDLHDLIIRDTAPVPKSLLVDRAGGAILCFLGCTGRLRRLQMDNNAFGGLLLLGRRNHLTVQDAVFHTSPQVTEDGPPKGGLGVAMLGGSLQMERFAIRDQAAVGFYFLDRAQLYLNDGDITGQPVGVDYLQLGGDTDDIILGDNIYFEDNQQDFARDPTEGLSSLTDLLRLAEIQ